MKVKVVLDARWSDCKIVEFTIKDEKLGGLTQEQIDELCEENAKDIFWEQCAYRWVILEK
jgi:hypothetical protein